MNYYHITAPHHASDSYYRSNFKANTQFVSPSQKSSLFVLKLEAPNPPFFFYNAWNHYFVNSGLKQELEAMFRELQFERLHSIGCEFNPSENIVSLNRDSFWKMNIPSAGGIGDFFLWQGKYLVVSQKALDFLDDRNLFQTETEGSEFGENYKVITNKFLLKGNIDDYFYNQWPIISKKIEEKRKLIMQEYRRRNNLPPLS